MNRYDKYRGCELIWIKEIPEHWEIIPISHVFEERKERNNNRNNQFILSVMKNTGVIPYTDKGNVGNKVSENIENYKVVYPNDLVLNSMNMMIGSLGKSNYKGVLSQVYYVLKLMNSTKYSIDYLSYLFKNKVFHESFRVLGKGILDHRLRVPMQLLKYEKILIPSINEQEQIANYLDWKINEINKLIKIENEKIKLLNELLAKEIENLIFNNSDKASNSNWYQSVPMLSEEIKIKFIFSLRDERNHLPESDVDLISLYTKWGVILNEDIEIKTGNKNTTVENYKKVYEDDIVVNIMLCWMGAIGVSKYNGVTSPAYDIYKPNLDLVVPKYYHYMFRTNKFRSELFKKGKGIVLMKWRVYSDKFKNIIVPLPEISEQKRIVELIEEKQKIALGNISIIKEKLTELKNLKQALISEVVTGKMDVRNVVIPEYEKVTLLDDETEEFDEMEGIEDGD